MTHYQHILVAVDSTDEAEQVLAHAHSLAHEHDAQLTVLNVIRPIHYAYSALDAGWIAREMAGFEEEAEDASRKRLVELAKQAGIDNCKVSVVLGEPAATIREQAQELNADLIVLGSHGRHGLGLILGSTANGVLHGAPCDVLAVRIAAQQQG